MKSKNAFTRIVTTGIILALIVAILPQRQTKAITIQNTFLPKPNDYAFALPFTQKGSWYWQGPHQSGIDNASTTWSGVDFIQTDRGEFDVRAAADGELYIRKQCRVTERGTGRYITSLGMIYIRHKDIYPNDGITGGIATLYIHVKYDPKKFSTTKSVTRGEIIGKSVNPDLVSGTYPSSKYLTEKGCGYGNVNHLHFSITQWEKTSTGYKYTNLPMNDFLIGGWKIKKGTIAYTGSMVWRDEKTIHKDTGEGNFGKAIWNNGYVGDGRAPGSIQLATPEHSALLQAGQNPAMVEYQWAPHENPWGNTVSYQIQVSTFENFSSVISDNKTKDTSLVLPMEAGNADTDYYWRVRGIDLNGTGAWSNTRQLTMTKLQIPAPTQLTPVNGAETLSDLSFSWTTIPAAEYYLEFAGPTSGNSGWITATTFPVTSLPAGAYTWHVKARNNGVESAWSQTWNFTVQPTINAPEAPTLSYPTENGNTSADVTFVWNSVPNATEYFIEYTGTFSSGNSGWISETTFPVTALPAGNYAWSVKARNGSSESDWSPTWSFAVQPSGDVPAPPTLSFPAENGTVPIDFTFAWNSVPDAIEYFMEYNGTAASGNSGWGASTSFPVTALPAGTYTWSVMARNSNGESGWSPTWAFTVEPVVINIPAAPTLTSPVNGTGSGSAVTLSWQSVSNAVEYYAEYSGASSGNSGWINGTSLPLTSLPAGAYTWKVKARNAGGESEWSVPWSFTVTTAPVAPILLLPADNATVVAASLSFSWNSTANATAYYFEYSGAMSGNSGWVTSTTAQIATPVNGVYTWRVKARNAGGESVWSQTRTVTFVSTPSQITINSPTTIYPTGACSTSNWMTFTNNLSHTYYVTQNNNINPWAANPNYTYWKASIPVAGRYKVEAYIPSHGTLSWCGAGGKSISANTTDAHYQIYTSGTTWTKVEKSQNIGGNVWLNLGEFQLANGNYNVVKLIDSNHQTSYSQLIFFSDIRITWVGQ